MKLAIFEGHRAGLVAADGTSLVDVSDLLRPDAQDLASGQSWWVRACGDFADLRPRLEHAAAERPATPLGSVRLLPPVLRPGKVVAAASNYASHRAEMAEARRRAGSSRTGEGSFEVFLKAPTSIVGPGATVLLPAGPLAQGREVHYETELALVIGRGGRDIPEADALDHVLGYTIAMDFTVRGAGDRSRRKSYDTFTPVGPWLTTADEVPDPESLDIRLQVNGQLRQDGNSADLLVGLRGIIAFASSVMTLEPGDLVLTGTPPGVGPVADGDALTAEIELLGRMDLTVSAPLPAAAAAGAPGGAAVAAPAAGR